MRLPEQRLWQRSSVHLRKWGVWLERVENIVGDGTPDVHGTCRGSTLGGFWVENKAVASPPARATTALLGKGQGHSLRTSQINWHLDYTKNGGRSYVLIGIGSHAALLMSAKLVIDLNSMTHDELLKAALVAVDAPGDWRLVAMEFAGER